MAHFQTIVLEHFPMWVLCVMCKGCRDTGVNVLEKSDLGQWSCLHLSL